MNKNTPSCCEKCSGWISTQKEDDPAKHGYYCKHPNCECHTDKATTKNTAGWEERFENEWYPWISSGKGYECKSFIRSVEQEAYERGYQRAIETL